MADLAEVAIDRLLDDQPLDELVRVERLLVERPAGLRSVALDELAGAPLVAGMDDAAVPRRRTPTERMCLQERDPHSPACQLSRGGDPGIAPADDHDIGTRRERPPRAIGQRRHRRLPERTALEVVVEWWCGRHGRRAYRSRSSVTAAGRTRDGGSVRFGRAPEPRTRPFRPPSSTGLGRTTPSRAAASSCPSTRARRSSPSSARIDRRRRGRPARPRPGRATDPITAAGPTVSAAIARASVGLAGVDRGEHESERRLDAADAVRREPELDRLVDLRVRRVVGGDRVRRPVGEGGEARQGRPIGVRSGGLTRSDVAYGAATIAPSRHGSPSGPASHAKRRAPATHSSLRRGDAA